MLKAHIILAIMWTLLIIPTVLAWKESIVWVAFMSIYAIIGFHVIGIMEALTKKAVKSGNSRDSNGEG